MTFSKDDYEQIIENIKQSKGYISYINSKADKGKTNYRYEKYITLKQAAYTSQTSSVNTDENMTSLFLTISDSPIEEAEVSRYLKEHGVGEDVVYSHELMYQDDDSFVVQHKVKTIEEIALDKALELDDHFERINRRHLREDFVLKNHQRFILPPFLAKYEGKYVQPIVIANIYDIGIITIQIIISFEMEKIDVLGENVPTNINFPSVDFYKKEKEYKSWDFEEKVTEKNMTPRGILEYYFDFIDNITKDIDVQKQEETQYAWVFGDFEIDKHPTHENFVERNRNYYAAHLINASNEQMKRFSKENIKEILKKSLIRNMKPMHYYCSEGISILSFSYSAFHENAVASLKEKESELKKKKAYDEALKEFYKCSSFIDMFEFLRIQELTYIKKYFAMMIFKKMSKREIKTFEEFNAITSELNNLNVDYDEQVLFNSVGSVRELYIDISEINKTNEILRKAEKMLSAIRDDVNGFREISIKKTETLILTMTSILTVLLGYRGIKFIVYDILVNLPWKMNLIFIEHPLRWTIFLWSLLLVLMLFLNVKKAKATKL